MRKNGTRMLLVMPILLAGMYSTVDVASASQLQIQSNAADAWQLSPLYPTESICQSERRVYQKEGYSTTNCIHLVEGWDFYYGH